MIRFCNKKCLFFLLIALCVASNNALFPMLGTTSKIFKKEHKEPHELPLSGSETTIEDVSDDSLCRIFQFYGKKALGLRLVIKQFKNVIESKPCLPCLFHTTEGEKTCFLKYYLKMTKNSYAKTKHDCIKSEDRKDEFAVKLYNKKNLIGFVDDFPGSVFDIGDTSFVISIIKLHNDYKDYSDATLKAIRKLHFEVNKKESRLNSLKVEMDGWHIESHKL